MDFPHGECECRDGCQCVTSPGPVAYEITRGDGQKLKVCTRCVRSVDVSKLLVTRKDSATLYRNYDLLGAMVIALTIDDKGLN